MKHSQPSQMSWVGISVLVLGLLVMQGAPLKTAVFARTPQGTQHLPVSAFLDVLDPFDAVGVNDPVTGNTLNIDAYGKRNVFFNLNLPTAVTGGVTVKDQGDGTQNVIVVVHTKNAICWGFNGDFVPAFGYRPFDVFSNLGPASLGDALIRLGYTQPTGPLGPPLFEDDINGVTASIMCDGQLRSGSGYPDGTPGFAQTMQRGLFTTGVPGGCPPERDATCFPAEKIQFKATGH
jgi:hypothetical protein